MTLSAEMESKREEKKKILFFAFIFVRMTCIVWTGKCKELVVINYIYLLFFVDLHLHFIGILMSRSKCVLENWKMYLFNPFPDNRADDDI